MFHAITIKIARKESKMTLKEIAAAKASEACNTPSFEDLSVSLKEHMEKFKKDFTSNPEKYKIIRIKIEEGVISPFYRLRVEYVPKEHIGEQPVHSLDTTYKKRWTCSERDILSCTIFATGTKPGFEVESLDLYIKAFEKEGYKKVTVMPLSLWTYLTL